ncbi:MAG: biotin/lipoate A/B protein ligase family protein [Candidatus Omnitrophica bacterium]|jgi:Lipoate-protein ligase A|nr:biotin/lipoate A/B protein ligase family protein [Candidatus Omnitrophota bacterium]
MKKWRLILSDKSDPFTNMAVDEAILQTYIHRSKEPTLRIYGWRPAAFSIGVGQKPAEALNLAACQEDRIDFVRRMTGGEAIFHDREITYSLVCSKQEMDMPNSVKQSFRILTGFILHFYEKLGVSPKFAADIPGYAHGNPSDFCFATMEEFDIMVKGKKIGGNAQKRIGDIIFQHGSIPLTLNINAIAKYFNRDIKSAASTIASLHDVVEQTMTFESCRDLLVASFETAFSAALEEQDLSVHEQDLAHVLAEEKYNTKQWNFYRSTRIETKE